MAIDVLKFLRPELINDGWKHTNNHIGNWYQKGNSGSNFSIHISGEGNNLVSGLYFMEQNLTTKIGRIPHSFVTLKDLYAQIETMILVYPWSVNILGKTFTHTDREIICYVHEILKGVEEIPMTGKKTIEEWCFDVGDILQDHMPYKVERLIELTETELSKQEVSRLYRRFRSRGGLEKFTRELLNSELLAPTPIKLKLED